MSAPSFDDPSFDDHAAFVRAHTRIASPPLVPEVKLHLAPLVTPLWEAMEAREGRHIPPPYWAACWPGGQVLSRLVLDRPALVRDRTVLDFATGCGVSAVTACLAGAARVIATEIDPLATQAARMNAELNDVSFELHDRDVVDTDEGWDVVFAGDVCYERAMAERITSWLRRLSARGALVLLGDPGRTYMPRDGLEELACHRVPVSRDLEDRDARDTAVWRVLP